MVQISHSSDGFRSTVQIIAEGSLRGEKQLVTKGDDCGPVVTSLALAVSLALDNTEQVPTTNDDDAEKKSVQEPSAPYTLPEQGPSAPLVPQLKEIAAPRELAPPVPPGAGLRLLLALGPEVSLGTAPAPTVGSRGTAALNWKRLALRVDPRVEAFGGKRFGLGAVVRTQWTSVDGTICYWHTFFACLGGGVGYLLSETDGIARPKQDSAPFGFLTIRAGAELSIGGRFVLVPELMAGANVSPMRVLVNQSPVHQQSDIFGSLGISIGARVF